MFSRLGRKFLDLSVLFQLQMLYCSEQYGVMTVNVEWQFFVAVSVGPSNSNYLT